MLPWFSSQFPRALDSAEREAGTDIRQHLLRFPLLLRLLQLTGIKAKPACLARLFEDPRQFAVPEPFALEDIEALEPKVKGISFENEIDQLLTDLSMKAMKNPEDALTQASAASQTAPVLIHHALARKCLSSDHPRLLQSYFRSARACGRQLQSDRAIELARMGLRATKAALGEYHPTFVVGLVTVGEILLNADASDPVEALQPVARALRSAQRLFGHHPMLGKLHSYVGKLLLRLGLSVEGYRHLNQAYRVYAVRFAECANPSTPL